MRLYHRTYYAEAILAEGFNDGRGGYLTLGEHRGVWLSADKPLDENEGAAGDVVLVVEVPEEAVADYEWIEEGKGYREFLIPAELLNACEIVDVRCEPTPETDAVREARGLVPFVSDWRTNWRTGGAR